MWDLFGGLDPARQAELLGTIFQVVVLGPSGVVGHVLREPFATLFTQATALKTSETPASNEDLHDITKQILDLAEGGPELATLTDSTAA